ncbi:M1 family metallopeptidase [Balneolales bacterium ANBcel1]|nr:M1 family metallopeptidase [Balneolales bacterium ANBcel1]
MNNLTKTIGIKQGNALLICVILGVLLSTSCSNLTWIERQEPIQEEWIIPEGPTQTLRERTWDLHHQKLWVRFDFDREQVIGRTEMLFTSKQEQSELVLDAKTMEFSEITEIGSRTGFDFRQDSAIVTIDLDRRFEAGDTLALGVAFISSPPNRGLYFVNPRGEDPVKPTQVWTLGQPEDNSFWFPTIDHPAERTTQETWIAVPPHFSTLSNGLLMESRVKEGDSLRTDYWVMNYPHAPYLFALAVGEYEIVEEIRDGILYRYYYEPQYAETVGKIYRNTVDMVRFSEAKTGRTYPWDPIYAQAPVHDFIARGMENTTATLLYDAVQFDRRAAMDLCNQDLIMHEVIHQWFGNLVTARDWANLPLNEGFANYIEALYRLHTDGVDAYLWKNQQNRVLYFDEATRYRRPVIFDQYLEPEDMYDRHTYQKAGQILRMLHNYLGDSTWQDGTRLWIDRFAFDSVDVFDLQEVFEEVSGEDLSWFFQQWFLEPGHPTLDVHISTAGQSAELTVHQVHDMERQPVYQLHPEVLIEFRDGSTSRRRFTIDKESAEFTIVTDKHIRDIVFDPNRVQLAEYILSIDDETLLYRLNSEHLLVRSEAISLIDPSAGSSDELIARITEMAISDSFWGTRLQAMQMLADWKAQGVALPDEEVRKIVAGTIFENEPDYRVRQEALFLLSALNMNIADNRGFTETHLNKMRSDTSYFVAASAIRITGELFPENAVDLVGPYSVVDSYQDVIKEAVTEVLIMAEDTSAVSYLLRLGAEPGDRTYTYRALHHLAENIPNISPMYEDRVRRLFAERIRDPYRSYRMLAYQALADMSAVEYIPELEQQEDHERFDEEERRALNHSIRILKYELEIAE